MKNLKYIMATLMVALIVAFVCVACNKDKETPVQEANNNSENKPDTEVVERKPIAVFDKNTGTMASLIDIIAVNAKLNEEYATRGSSERYVIESAEVLDSVPHNKDVSGEIKITLLDTEEECSYSIWYMKNFVVKDVKEQQVDYYLDENVANGNFDVAFKEGDNYYVADFVDDSISIHKLDSLDYGSCPWYIFTCRSTDCLQYCDKEGSAWHAWCRPCSSYYVGGECNADFTAIQVVIGLAIRGARYFLL